jgi:AraC family transcriptional regulator
MFRSLTNHRSPISTLRAFRTADYSVLLQAGGPMFLPARYSNFHVVGIPLASDYAIGRASANEAWRGRLTPRDVSIHPAGSASEVVWPDGATCLYIHFRAEFIAEQAGAWPNNRRGSIETHHTRRDRTIREIGAELVEAMTSSSPPREGHALIQALGVHVARGYPSDPPAAPMLGCRPLDSVMDDLRLGATAAKTVSTLARSCGLTRAHFTRRFKLLTGESPHTLVLGSRIEHAKHLLTSGALTIGGVAYEAGFADQSHLSHTFQRLVGMTPARFQAFHRATLERVRSTNLQYRA